MQTPIILGGSGVVVEIDESLFRHKPKVRFASLVSRLSLLPHTYDLWPAESLRGRRKSLRLRLRFAMVAVLILFILTASQGKTNHSRDLGFGVGRYVAHTSIGLHGNCKQARCSHPTSYYSKTCCTRDRDPFRPVGSLHSCGWASQCQHTFCSEPYVSLHWSGHWYTYTTYWILLEQNKN